MGSLTAWFAEISRMVPGAKPDVINTALHVKVREFCSKTLLYVRTLTPINIVANIGTYNLVAPTDTVIVMVERVEVDGQPLDPTSLDLLDRSPEAWQPLQARQPNEYMVDVEKVLRFKQIPNTAITGGLVLSVSLKPTWTTLVVPDFIYEDWYDAIKYGALAYLLKMPNQVYSNMAAADQYDKDYKVQLSDAKNRKYTGKAKVSIRVQPKPFTIVG